MENEFEYLVVRRGDGGHFAEKFVKKVGPSQSYHSNRQPCRDSAFVTRQRLPISAIISKQSVLILKNYLLPEFLS